MGIFEVPMKTMKLLLFATFACCILSTPAAGAASFIDWVNVIGGTNRDDGRGVSTDLAGSVYITGSFQATADFGGTSLSAAGDSDIYVAKYNSAGTLHWVRGAGGSAWDSGYGVANDSQNNCIVVGNFNASATFASTNIVKTGNQGLFVAKYSTDGTFQWVRQAGGLPAGAVVDQSDNIFVVGNVSGSVSFGPTNVTSQGVADAFVAKYDSNGIFRWVRLYGGTGTIYPSSIRLLSNQEMIMTGDFGNTTAFGSVTLTNASGNGNMNSFIVRLTTSGAVAWAKTISTANSGTQIGPAAVDSTDAILVSGHFGGLVSFEGLTNFTSFGGSDIFVAKYSSGGLLTFAQQIGGIGGDSSYSGIGVNSKNEYYLSGTIGYSPYRLAISRRRPRRVCSKVLTEWRIPLD